jgi:MFS family permease
MMVPVGRIIILRTISKSQLVDALAWLTIPALMGPLVGPPIGGFITTYFDWRWIFWMNIPIGLLGIALATRLMPNMRAEAVPPLDFWGFLLSALGLPSVVFGFTIVGRGLLPDYALLALIIFGSTCLALYVRHAFSIQEPILDLRLLQIQSFRASIVGGSFYRIGVGAIPFLMPLMFQLGFGFTAFQSGLLTCSAAAGAMAMKFSTSRLLRRFGFPKLLIANGMVSCCFMAACGLLTALTPFAVISLLVLVGGFLRSLQFTALNALSYADIDRNEASKATSLYTVAQQISLSAGVAVAAFILESMQALRGSPDILAGDFSIAFLLVAGVAAFSVLQFLWLGANAGASVLARHLPTPQAAAAEAREDL